MRMENGEWFRPIGFLSTKYFSFSNFLSCLWIKNKKCYHLYYQLYLLRSSFFGLPYRYNCWIVWIFFLFILTRNWSDLSCFLLAFIFFFVFVYTGNIDRLHENFHNDHKIPHIIIQFPIKNPDGKLHAWLNTESIRICGCMNWNNKDI